MSKFTPGPWRYAAKSNIGNCVEAQSGKKLYDLDDGYRTVAAVQPCLSSELFVDEQENLAANIALIAAAPDMLDTLLAMREAIYEQPIGCWFHAIEAAIAKATGVQS